MLDTLPQLAIKPNTVGHHTITVPAKRTREIENQAPLMTDIYIRFT